MTGNVPSFVFPVHFYYHKIETLQTRDYSLTLNLMPFVKVSYCSFKEYGYSSRMFFYGTPEIIG
jgi:hypothetical protein